MNKCDPIIKIMHWVNRLTVSVLFSFCLVFLPAFSAGSAILPDTSFQHQRDVGFTNAQPLSFQVRATDSQTIASVRCYFRFQEESEYLYIELNEVDEDIFQGVLPPPALSVSTIEYFFLAVNKKEQVVRSLTYMLNQNTDDEIAGKNVVAKSQYVLKTELPELPTEAVLTFFDPDQIAIEKTVYGEQYGLVSGIYTTADFPGTELAEGYYGAFVVDVSGKYIPAKGLLHNEQERKPSAATSNQFAESSIPETAVETTSDIVGPDIQGDDWTGTTYLQDSQGNKYYETRVSAVVTQENDQVTITLTYTDYNVLPISDYYWGTIVESGHMTLYDEFNPPETWTTYFRPATETSITIADFTDQYDPDENPYPDLYVVDLLRDPAPPPPPPPPEPEPFAFLQAVYMLLLSQNTP